MHYMFACPSCNKPNFTRFPGIRVLCDHCGKRVRSPGPDAYSCPATVVDLRRKLSDLFYKLSDESKARRWNNFTPEKKAQALARMTRDEQLRVMAKVPRTELQSKLISTLVSNQGIEVRRLEEIIYGADSHGTGGAEEQLKKLKHRLNGQLRSEGWPIEIKSRKKRYSLVFTSG